MIEPSVIRELTAGELGLVAAMGAEFYAAASLPGRFVPERFLESWRGFYRLGFGTVFGAVHHGGDGERIEAIEGAIGGLIVPDPNDGELVCSELFWWVRPEARGRGLELLRVFESWARENGAKRIVMVAMETSMAEKLEKVYRRRGYRALERHYSKELKGGEVWER